MSESCFTCKFNDGEYCRNISSCMNGFAIVDMAQKRCSKYEEQEAEELKIIEDKLPYRWLCKVAVIDRKDEYFAQKIAQSLSDEHDVFAEIDGTDLVLYIATKENQNDEGKN